MIDERRLIWSIGGFGLLTALLLLIGLNTIGGVFALFHLGLFVGAPLALVLQKELRSWMVATVISAVLSVALSAIAVQLLVWFRIASGELVVVTATAYSVVLALLLAQQDFGRSNPASQDLQL